MSRKLEAILVPSSISRNLSRNPHYLAVIRAMARPDLPEGGTPGLLNKAVSQIFYTRMFIVECVYEYNGSKSHEIRRASG
jgi:hypothetical protein